jgi:hypothetical protein
MSDLRFEKHRVPATITLSTGVQIRGWFFVVGALPSHGGPERVGDLLNAEDGFFPFQREDGTTGQFNRAHVVQARLAPDADEESLEPGHSVERPREVSLTLSTGTQVAGTVFVSGPTGHERLSDYARRARHFFYLVTTGGTLVVNTHHVVELEERTA